MEILEDIRKIETNLILTDENHAYYGVLRVESTLNDKDINYYFRRVIENKWKNGSDFWEEFSENLEIAVEELEKELKKYDKNTKATLIYNHGGYFDFDTIY